MNREDRAPNYAASVHQRLLDLARQRQTDFNLVLQRYAVERFLYRLSVSGEVDAFTLKGASLFLLWTGMEFRPTRDVDLLGAGPPDETEIQSRIERICAEPCVEDGVVFDTESIRIEEIREGLNYGGIRVRLQVELGQARITLQADVGFGDVITPERQVANYPTLLELPSPRIWTYPKETFVAEKFESIVRLGPRNSRIKDFWDLAAVAGHFEFHGETLVSAVDETFRRRGSSLEEVPDALRPTFYEDADRIRSWEAFQQMAGEVVKVPARFDTIGEVVRGFVGPVREAVVTGGSFTRVWGAAGPWAARASTEMER